MKFKDLVSVSDMSGLFQLVGTKSDGAIVKDLGENSTKFISARKHDITPLESIEVYTETENIPLSQVFLRFHENEPQVETVNVYKEGKDKITEVFSKLLPDYDKSRVYISDMKKMLKWYGIIKEMNLLDTLKKEDEVEEQQSE